LSVTPEKATKILTLYFQCYGPATGETDDVAYGDARWEAGLRDILGLEEVDRLKELRVPNDLQASASEPVTTRFEGVIASLATRSTSAEIQFLTEGAVDEQVLKALFTAKSRLKVTIEGRLAEQP
jgi:hypothetical protein